jgi:hypothetical protein
MTIVLDSYAALQRKCARLQTQQERIRADLWRCREESSNFREAAFLWLRLDERQLVRANDLRHQLQQRADAKGPVKALAET